MGKERRLQFHEVMIIAIVAELTRLGLAIGAASHAAEALVNDDRFRDKALSEEGWVIVLSPSPAPVGVSAPTLAPRALFRPKSLNDLGGIVSKQLGNPSSFVVVQISDLKRRVVSRLDGLKE